MSKFFIKFFNRERLLGAGVILFSLFFALAFADILLRALRLPLESRSIMLLSGSIFSTDEFGVRRYEPGKNVEQAALIDGKIAYRYKYRTNNLGLVSEHDYRPGEILDLMITGDSMTEGQEVGPWLDEFQNRLLQFHGKSSQNFGIAGSGFIEFERAAAFAKFSLNARKAMIIFIADDMLRPGDQMVANADCSSYKNYGDSALNCFSGRPTWHHYEANLSDSELVAYAERLQRFGLLRSLRRPAVDAAKYLIRMTCGIGIRLDPSTSLGRIISGECDPQNAASSTSIAQGLTIPSYTVEAYRKLLRLYGPENVMMLMIPGGTSSFNKLQPQQFFGEIFKDEIGSQLHFVDISESCDMPVHMWSRGGIGHPTPEGYKKLQSCVLANDAIMRFSTSQ